MDQEKIKEIEPKLLILLCGHVDIVSQFGYSVSTDSRMVKERQDFLPLFFSRADMGFNTDVSVEFFQEALALSTLFKEKARFSNSMLLKDHFMLHSTETDWASFLKRYNLFSIWKKKEWNNQRIKNMRYLFGMLYRLKR